MKILSLILATTFFGSMGPAFFSSVSAIPLKTLAAEWADEEELANVPPPSKTDTDSVCTIAVEYKFISIYNPDRTTRIQGRDGVDVTKTCDVSGTVKGFYPHDKDIVLTMTQQIAFYTKKMNYRLKECNSNYNRCIFFVRE